VGISVDSFAANKRFADDIGVKFPLLSDLTRKTSKEYGILDEENQVARRTTFVVDGEGIIRYIVQGGDAIDPSGAHAACSRLPKKS